MKKTETVVREEVEEVEKRKCDECGVVEESDEMNVLTLDIEMKTKRHRSFGDDNIRTESWSGFSTYRSGQKKIEPKDSLDLCDDCLEKHTHDGEQHEKDEIDRELEREME